MRVRHWALALVACAFALGAFGTASAFAETRTLKFYNLHTKERGSFAYKRNGRYVQSEVKKINWFLRDWRQGKATTMDPQLLDLLWEAYRQAGARDYINVVSAYRSPATNGMLRRTRGGQAKKSQHMVGRALDFFIPGVKLSTLRAIGLKMQVGGVGYYPKSGSPFVHFDTGNARHWPRMSRRELASVFPNGGTVHVPSDGKPLPGYQQALASYKQRRAAGDLQVANASSSSGGGRTLLSMLFGGGADEEEDNAEAMQAPTQVARARPQPQAPVVADVVPTSRPNRPAPQPAAVAMLDAGFDTGRDRRNDPAAAVNGGLEESQVASIDPSRIPSPRWAPARAVPANLENSTPERVVPSADATAAMIAALETQAEEEKRIGSELAYTVPTPSGRPAFNSVLKEQVAAVIPPDAPKAPPAMRQVSLPQPSVRPTPDVSAGVAKAASPASVDRKPVSAVTAALEKKQPIADKGGWPLRSLRAGSDRTNSRAPFVPLESEDDINARIQAAVSFQ
ncbi:ATP/GTP-binding site motif A (P-loop) [Fulvimarina pelagi HTCC2506]|uniref:Murein endopeptidase K n=1 Tax=Fulvimarina pelagi HTCC2506 TaxID=314231 RepID=Q0G0S4_9HYPH|nr:ATP/GTP-binding site motif A (P-loop) [Fulvimarina pelagi HTCC2506]